MNKDQLLTSLSEATPVSETDVRTNIAIPILQYLGFPDCNRAEEFPVYAFEGRKAVHSKPADVLLFDCSQHTEHREKDHREWVKEHSLLVVELKRPSESMDAHGQAEFYSLWTRAPFYVITNGKELAVYRIDRLSRDTLELKCEIRDLSEHLAQLERLLRPEHIRAYCETNRLKAPSSGKTDYTSYLAARRLELQSRLQHSISRTLSEPAGATVISIPLQLRSSRSNSGEPVPFTDLLSGKTSTVVIGEPGAGKSYLLDLLASETIDRSGLDQTAHIPIIIHAKLWGRRYKTLVDAIKDEVELHVPGITTTAIVENDLRNGVFLLIIDGLDETVQDLDLLYAEILKISRGTPTQIIATCRQHRYHEELGERLATYRIDPLTDDRIRSYAARVLGDRESSIAGFAGMSLWERWPSLIELVRQPLFLIMTLAVLQDAPDAKLPRNRSALYERFSRRLLQEWRQAKAAPAPYVVDLETKTRVLADFAFGTLRRSSSYSELNRAISKHGSMYDPLVVRSEILDSGLLHEAGGLPEFFHPSFQEYFFSVQLAGLSDDELVSFIHAQHSDETYLDVLLFLAGLLQEENRQSLLFDYLEQSNLPLCYQCLETRFDRSEKIIRDWSEELAETYLGQVRASYERIVRGPFSKMLPLFDPWSGIRPYVDNHTVAIRGWVDPVATSVSFNLVSLPANSGDPLVVATPAGGPPTLSFQDQAGQQRHIAMASSFYDSTGYTFHDLKFAADGIDSAREVALLHAKHGLKGILADRGFWLIDDNILACEFVECALRQVDNAGDPQVPPQLRSLTLRTTAPCDILDVLQRHINFPPEGPPPHWRRLFYNLERMKHDDVDAREYLLPKQDLTVADVSPRHGGTILACDLWSDDQLQERIAKFYDFFQQAYRYVVEHYLPSFTNDLYTYRLGPIRYHVEVRRGVSLHDPGLADVRWEPVAPQADSSTVVTLVDHPPARLDAEGWQEEHRSLRRLFKSLGRRAPDSISRPWLAVTRFTSSEEIIRSEVYEQLKTEFEEIFGRL